MGDHQKQIWAIYDGEENAQANVAREWRKLGEIHRRYFIAGKTLEWIHSSGKVAAKNAKGWCYREHVFRK